MKCANKCGQDIRPIEPEDGLDPRDWDGWTHTDGDPLCGIRLQATPSAFDLLEQIRNALPRDRVVDDARTVREIHGILYGPEV